MTSLIYLSEYARHVFVEGDKRPGINPFRGERIDLKHCLPFSDNFALTADVSLLPVN